ncbi:MAG: APA family basic amino acid/polyamine antiporter [Saprospiraceae bacterium]|jgi:APA family basic amino acid/polyamine antiporter
MTELKKKLNLYGLTMIAVGSCIGAGIFTAPGQVAAGIDSQAFVLMIWLLGGFVALMGALTFAELGSLFPKSGGVYVYLKEAYGDMAGFLYGWVILLIINTGAMAFLAELFVEYIVAFDFFAQFGKDWLAVSVILLLTGLNIFGVNIIQIFANLFTGLKLLAIVVIVVLGLWFVQSKGVETFEFTFSNAPEDYWTPIFVGLIGVFFSMGGWHHTTYLSGETINASKNVPRAMVFGVLIVTLMYMLINWVYMLLLPLPDIAATRTVAGDAFSQIFPLWGSRAISILVAVSVFGTIGIYTVTAPRIYFAMARDGIFFKQLAYLHPQYKTPVVAMVAQAIVTCFLIIAFDKLYDLMAFVTFMDILFMTLAAISIFVFRIKMKDVNRLVKVPFYPVVPLIFILLSGIFVAVTLMQVPGPTWWAMAILAVGIPVYYLFKWNKK